MADFDPLTVPAVMPASVRRITEQNLAGQKVQGFPTQALLDYEQALQSWMKSNVANTNTRLNLVSDQVGDVAASVETETQARIDGDTALAQDITTVSASVRSISAQGQVYLAAKATPLGATAAYGWYLTAGNAFAGMEAVALSGGGSAIGFAAEKFYFTDSGTAQAVFDYSAGVWTFTVPIAIRSGTSGARIEITSENIKVYDASNVLRVAIGINI